MKTWLIFHITRGYLGPVSAPEWDWEMALDRGALLYGDGDDTDLFALLPEDAL